LLCFALNDLTYCPKVTTANVAQAENLDLVGNLAGVARAIGGGEVLRSSDGEGPALSVGGTDNSIDEGASDDENSQRIILEHPPLPKAESKR
jgi:hypothetical protein